MPQFKAPPKGGRLSALGKKSLNHSTENVAWCDTDDCSMMDKGHYDATDLLEIGKRFARALKIK
jgi:hypothetical protein